MPIRKSDCRSPRRWYVETSLRTRRQKGKCQSFTKRRHAHPVQAITKAWVTRMCHNERVRCSKLLAEEIRGQATWFIETMIDYMGMVVLPCELQSAVKTEYALSNSEFEALVRVTRPDAVVSVQQLHMLHVVLESYLHQLFYQGAIMAKKSGEKSLEPRRVNEVRLTLFPYDSNVWGQEME